MKYINWLALIIGVTAMSLLVLHLKEDTTSITTKYRTFTLAGSTFDMDVTVLVTKDTAFAVNYVRKNLDSTVTAKDFNARAVSFPINDGRSPIIWIGSTEDKGVIAHEIFHTALNIMYWTGMELNSETEEAFAYEVQFLTNSFYNQINTIK